MEKPLKMSKQTKKIKKLPAIVPAQS